MVSFFSFFIMSLYSMFVRILDEALGVCYSKRKKQVKLRAGGLESVYISVKGRVRFKGNLFRFFMLFPRGWLLFVVARCL